jgi:hypothetical protein
MILGTLKHAQTAAIEWNRRAIARAKAGMDVSCTLGSRVHLLIHPWVLLTIFAGPHVGAVPQRGNNVAYFETSMLEIEELQD